MGKQNLEKCLIAKPQSEQPMWTSYPKTLTAFRFNSCNPREGYRQSDSP